MNGSKLGLSRRSFLRQAAAGAAAVTIVPRNVLGQGQTPPSETIGAALIGCGGRGPGTFRDLKQKHGLNTVKLARNNNAATMTDAPMMAQ